MLSEKLIKRVTRRRGKGQVWVHCWWLWFLAVAAANRNGSTLRVAVCLVHWLREQTAARNSHCAVNAVCNKKYFKLWISRGKLCQALGLACGEQHLSSCGRFVAISTGWCKPATSWNVCAGVKLRIGQIWWTAVCIGTHRYSSIVWVMCYATCIKDSLASLRHFHGLTSLWWCVYTRHKAPMTRLCCGCKEVPADHRCLVLSVRTDLLALTKTFIVRTHCAVLSTFFKVCWN